VRHVIGENAAETEIGQDPRTLGLVNGIGSGSQREATGEGIGSGNGNGGGAR
jgi:hypothetical protein